MRRAAKVDDNQEEIAEALQARGHLVRSTAGLGAGFFDLLIGAKRPTVRFANGRPIPDFDRILIGLEVKTRRNKRGDLHNLTDAESKFHREWIGFPIYIVGSVDQAIAAVEHSEGVRK